MESKNGLLNTLRPRQNVRHFTDDIFNCICLNEMVWISINISLKFVPKGPIHNIPALVQIMAWRRSGDKPLSEPMMVSSLTHICVIRPQWVKYMFQWIIWVFSMNECLLHLTYFLAASCVTIRTMSLSLKSYIYIYNLPCVLYIWVTMHHL